MSQQSPYSSNVDSTPAKKPIWKKWWAWLIGIVIIGGIATAGGESEEEDTASNDTTETTVVDETTTEQSPEPEQVPNTKAPKAETTPAQENPDINPWAKSVVGLSPDANYLDALSTDSAPTWVAAITDVSIGHGNNVVITMQVDRKTEKEQAKQAMNLYANSLKSFPKDWSEHISYVIVEDGAGTYISQRSI
ncbi:hypothetical protein ABRP69_11280 [Corynebacterium sp. KPL3806]|uniref:hypothetical protein n=1 Tax=Corynebacterium sp. KPL3806 TaxID=3158323 RepID=UPI0032EBEBC5